MAGHDEHQVNGARSADRLAVLEQLVVPSAVLQRSRNRKQARHGHRRTIYEHNDAKKGRRATQKQRAQAANQQSAYPRWPRRRHQARGSFAHAGCDSQGPEEQHHEGQAPRSAKLSPTWATSLSSWNREPSPPHANFFGSAFGCRSSRTATPLQPLMKRRWQYHSKT